MPRSVLLLPPIPPLLPSTYHGQSTNHPQLAVSDVAYLGSGLLGEWWKIFDTTITPASRSLSTHNTNLPSILGFCLRTLHLRQKSTFFLQSRQRRRCSTYWYSMSPCLRIADNQYFGDGKPESGVANRGGKFWHVWSVKISGTPRFMELL
jgi:hypothetical protein